MSTHDQRKQQVERQTNVANQYNTFYGHDYRPPTLSIDDAYAQLAKMPVDRLPESISDLQYSKVDRCNDRFTGREDELCALAAHFKNTLGQKDEKTIPQPAVITGIGGVGKSEMAKQLAHRYGQYFAGNVYMINMGGDESSIEQEIAKCGHLMSLEGIDPYRFSDMRQEAQCERVWNLWKSPLPRLLIFDNCNQPEQLEGYLPSTGGCCVLITSRHQIWYPTLPVYMLPLDGLSRADSIEVLLKYLPALHDLETNSVLKKSAESADDFSQTLSAILPAQHPLVLLSNIAEELADLPLAIDLAGAYLASDLAPDLVSDGDDICLEEYLEEYLDELQNTSPLEHPSLHSELGSRLDRDEISVSRTFTLSTNRLNPAKKTDQLAQDLLARMACFAPGEQIPHSLLLDTLNDRVAKAEKRKALRRLLNLGLFTQNKVDGITQLQLHRLVHGFIHHLDLDQKALTTVKQTLVRTLEIEVENTELNSPLRPASWLAHLRHITDQATACSDLLSAKLCHRLGQQLAIIGEYPEAQSYYEQSLAIQKSIHEADSLYWTEVLDSLATLQENLGEYSLAYEYYQQVLTIRQKELGKRDPIIARSLNNLGFACFLLDEYQNAANYYEQALAISQQVLDKNHPLIMTIQNNFNLLSKPSKLYKSRGISFAVSRGYGT